MGFEQQTDLSGSEVDAFLGRHETGVLTLAHADEPYAIPVSYGYDATERTFYFQLVSTADSEKRRFLAASPQARFVVTEERDGDFRSAIAVGTLRKVFRDELTVEDIHQYSEARRPLLELWGEADGDIQLYELDADSLSGRHFAVER